MITSTQNSQVKDWIKLHNKKYRVRTQSFLIEGYHLVEDALKSGWDIETLIVQDGIQLPDWLIEHPYTTVEKQVFAAITQTEAPQGVAAVVKMKNATKTAGEYVLLIDQVQDPGNLGTMIRTADAAGFSQVVLGKGTVDLYNDKVIRASQGSIFHIPIIEADLLDVIPALQNQAYTVLASALENSVAYDSVENLDKVALIMGNEGSGIAPEILQLADKRIKIPIYGQAESLNVSIAAGILMYQLRK
ncbi:MAG TPA: RNA methyltransferase [Gammaproteobacteria bacterium]|nr:RNA methyltransferase [Gammaproteobacteria bacterium]